MCNCLHDFIQKREDKFTTIAYDWNGNGNSEVDRILLKTYNPVDHSHKKPQRIVALYCPFCGEKYPTVTDESIS